MVSSITVADFAAFLKCIIIFLLLYCCFTMEGLTLISSFFFLNQLDS